MTRNHLQNLCMQTSPTQYVQATKTMQVLIIYTTPLSHSFANHTNTNMKMSRIMYFLFFFFLLSNHSTAVDFEVPSCATVIGDLTPCLSYLQGQPPSAMCCSGVKSLYSIAKTKADRVAACKCAKAAIGNISYDPKLLPPLPKKCGVNFNMPAIDKSFDCNNMPM